MAAQGEEIESLRETAAASERELEELRSALADAQTRLTDTESRLAEAQAQAEARTARALGYHAILLGLGAMRGAGEDELIAHCRAVAEEMPLIGFYLQTYLRMIDYPAASTVILVTVAMVMVVDALSSKLRERLV